MHLLHTSVNLQQAFKLAISMTMLYWLALFMSWDLPKYGGLAIALISLDTTGASLHKGLLRLVGTAIGLAAGIFGLACFAQDSWLTLTFLACYLLVVSYFLQTSRYPYAWFVAGFLPPLVWATTYGKIDNAFTYATFRYLETTAGVVIYTAVSALIWPRQAGDELVQQSQNFCQQLHKLFELSRSQFESASDSADRLAKRAEVAGIAARITEILDAAYADTPSVAKRRNVWEAFRANTRIAVDSLELWGQCCADCRRLDLERWMPNLPNELEHLEQRLIHTDRLWRHKGSGESIRDSQDKDAALLTTHPLELAEVPAGELSQLDLAALICFTQQLNLFSQASSHLLGTTRELVGLSPVDKPNAAWLPKDLFRPSRWDPSRLLGAALPALCFVFAWFFWIYFNPPAGPSLVSQAATFGLLVVMSPSNLLKIIPVMLISILGVIAPVYFLLMPRLSTGTELLALVFGFSFAVSFFLVGRLAVLRTLILASFVMMTNINNHQLYSFNGLVDGAIMLMLSIVIVAIVQALVTPLKPENALTNSVRSFFRGCTRIIDEYNGPSDANAAKQQRLRKRWFESRVLPGPARARAATQNLDCKQYPDDTPQKVQQLVNAMQNVANRLQALEISHQRFVAHTDVGLSPFNGEVDGVRIYLKKMSETCARLDATTVFRDPQTELMRLSTKLQKQVDRLPFGLGQHPTQDPVLANAYAMLGAVRGLVEAMGTAHLAISQIHWARFTKPCF